MRGKDGARNGDSSAALGVYRWSRQPRSIDTIDSTQRTASPMARVTPVSPDSAVHFLSGGLVVSRLRWIPSALWSPAAASEPLPDPDPHYTNDDDDDNDNVAQEGRLRVLAPLREPRQPADPCSDLSPSPFSILRSFGMRQSTGGP